MLQAVSQKNKQTNKQGMLLQLYHSVHQAWQLQAADAGMFFRHSQQSLSLLCKLTVKANEFFEL